MSSRTISVSIACPSESVYDFVSDPEHLPAWAPAFAKSVRQLGENYVVDTDDGQMLLEFTPRNPFGVVDYRVLARPEAVARPESANHLRVLSNCDGAEVLLTLFRRPEVSEEEFEAEAARAEGDFRTLKRLLEAEEP